MTDYKQKLLDRVWCKDTPTLLVIKSGDNYVKELTFTQVQRQICMECRTIDELAFFFIPDFSQRRLNRRLKRSDVQVFGILKSSVRSTRELYFHFLGDRLEINPDSISLANAIAQSAKAG